MSSRLNELEERAEELDRKRSSKISSIALINDKNRKKNIERAEQGIRLEMERIKREGTVSDPFTRRKTQPVLATHVLKKEGEETRSSVQVDIIPSDQIKLDKENVEKDKDEAKMKKEAAEDLFSAHDFDITIDLDTVSSNSSTSNVNLKPVTATTQSAGPKKSLNLADYKKKRGLI